MCVQPDSKGGKYSGYDFHGRYEASFNNANVNAELFLLVFPSWNSWVK